MDRTTTSHKILSILLAIVLAVSLTPSAAWATGETETTNDATTEQGTETNQGSGTTEGDVVDDTTTDETTGGTDDSTSNTNATNTTETDEAAAVAETEEPVASVTFNGTTTEYTSFIEAAKAAAAIATSTKDNQIVVKLLQNTAFGSGENLEYDSNSSDVHYVTFDFGDYTLDLTAARYDAFMISTGYEVTFTASDTGGINAGNRYFSIAGDEYYGDGVLNIESGTYTGEIYINRSGGTVNISGGTFYTSLLDTASSLADANPNINITGGTFSGISDGTVVTTICGYGINNSNTNLNYFVESGYIALTNDDGVSQTVIESEKANAVILNSNGGTIGIYDTAQDALKAVSADGQTVQLLTDVNLADGESLSYSGDYSATLDLAGYSVTGNVNGGVVDSAGTDTLTVTNSSTTGTITNNSAETNSSAVASSGGLALGAVTLDAKVAAVSATAGTVSVTGDVTATGAGTVFNMSGASLEVAGKVTSTNANALFLESNSTVALNSGSFTSEASTLTMDGSAAITIAEDFTFNNSLSITSASLSAKNVTFPYETTITTTGDVDLSGSSAAGKLTVNATTGNVTLGSATLNGYSIITAGGDISAEGLTAKDEIGLSGANVTLANANASGYVDITATGNVTVSGSSIAGNAEFTAKNGTVTIADTDAAGNLTIISKTANIDGNLSSALTVEADDITITDGTYNSLSTEGNGTLTIKDGIFNGNLSLSSTNVVIEGGTFEKSVDFNGSGTLTVSGGTFANNVKLNSGTAKVSGGSFSADFVFGSSNATSEITGGSFNNLQINAGSVTVSGGTITNFTIPLLGGSLTAAGGVWSSSASPANYLASGYTYQQLSDGTYAVYEPTDVAVANGVGYTDLESAVAAAANGGTVSLLQDVQLSETLAISEGANVTINLNNYTIWAYSDNSSFTANSSNPALIYNEGTLTVQNGTLKTQTTTSAYATLELLTLVNAGTATVYKSTISSETDSGQNTHRSVPVRALSGSTTNLENSAIYANGTGWNDGGSYTGIDARHSSTVVATDVIMNVSYLYSYVDLEGSANVTLKGGTYSGGATQIIRADNYGSSCPTLTIDGATIGDTGDVSEIKGSYFYATATGYSWFNLNIKGGTVFNCSLRINPTFIIDVDGATVNGRIYFKGYNGELLQPKSSITLRNIYVKDSYISEDPSNNVYAETTIYSGTFGNNVSTVQGVTIPTGYVCEQDASTGYYKVSTGGNVAIDSDGKAYSDLSEALNHGGTITLIADTTLTEGVTLNEGVTTTLNLAGWDLSYNGEDAAVTNNGNLTITGSGTISNLGSGAVVANAGALTTDSTVTLDAAGTALNQTAGTTTVNGTTLEADDTVIQASGGTITVASATVAGSANTVFHTTDSGVITITDGTFTTSDGAMLLAEGSSSITVNSGTYTLASGTVAKATGSATITISNGTFNRSVATTTEAFTAEGNSLIAIKNGTFNLGSTIAMSGNVVIYQGTFSGSVAGFLTEGAAQTANTDGTYTIKTAAAKVGSTFYANLQDALDAARNGGTVVLLNDVSTDTGRYYHRFTASGTLTLDLNGYSIGSYGYYGVIENTGSGTLTIEDNSAAKTGTIYADSGMMSAAVFGWKGSTTIIKGVTIKATGVAAVAVQDGASATVSDYATLAVETIQEYFSAISGYAQAGSVIELQGASSSFTMTSGTIKRTGPSSDSATYQNALIQITGGTANISGVTISDSGWDNLTVNGSGTLNLSNATVSLSGLQMAQVLSNANAVSVNLDGVAFTGTEGTGGIVADSGWTGAITVGGNTSFVAANSGVTNNSASTITVNGGTFTGGIVNASTGAVNVTGGTFGAGVTNSNTGTIALNGGTFAGGVTNSAAGTVEVKGGNFAGGVTNSSTGAVTVTDGTFTGDDANLLNTGTGKLYVEGGTFDGTVTSGKWTAEVSGGTFGGSVFYNTVEGYYTYQDPDDDKYKIDIAEFSISQNVVDDDLTTYYYGSKGISRTEGTLTLADVYSKYYRLASQDKQLNIKLYSDIELTDGTLRVGQGITATLDLNGYTLTGTSSDTQTGALVSSSCDSLTILTSQRGGTIINKNTGSQSAVVHSGSGTVYITDGVTIKATGASAALSCYSGMNVTGATVTSETGYVLVGNGYCVINSGTYERTGSGYYFFSEAGTVVIHGGNFIDANSSGMSIGKNITIDGGTFTYNDSFYVQYIRSVSISGGTFSSNLDSSYLAEGYGTCETADGMWNVVKANATVTTGDKTNAYETLQEAVDAASAGSTITLGDDIELTEAVNIPTNLTLDLAGHSITGNIDGALINAYANVTLSDSSENATGCLTNTSTGSSSCVVNVGESNSVAGALTLKTVAFDSDVSAIKVTSASGKVTMDENSTVTLNGAGSFINNESGTVTITGGTVKRAVASNTALMLKGEDATYSITGGTFDASVWNVLPPKYTEVVNSDGTYGVELAAASVTTSTSAVGYASLAEALQAVTADATVLLYEDAELASTYTVPSGVALTLNTDSHAITASASGAAIANNGTLTITGGGAISNGANVVVANTGTLTLESGTLSTTGVTAIISSAGSVTINGAEVSATGTTSNYTTGGGALFITGGTAEVKSGMLAGGTYGVSVTNGGAFTLTDGTVTSAGYTLWTSGVATATINGGTLNTSSNSLSAIYGYNGTDLDITVNGGTVQRSAVADSGTNSIIYLQSMSADYKNNVVLTINGGTFSDATASTTSGMYISGANSSVYVYGGTFEQSLYRWGGTSMDVLISSGKFAMLYTSDVTLAQLKSFKSDASDLNDDGTYYAVSMSQGVTGSTLSLDSGEIVVNSYFSITQALQSLVSNGEDAYIQATVNGESVKQLVSASENQGNYVLSVGMAAKEMTDDITIAVYRADGTRTSEEVTYSIADYANAIITNAKTEKYPDEMVTLAKALLNYGTYAQAYFGYNMDDLANAKLDSSEKTLTASAIGLTTSSSNDTTYLNTLLAQTSSVRDNDTGTRLSFEGCTLVLESSTNFRFYFSGSTANFSNTVWTIDGVTVTPQYSSTNKRWYVEASDIPATDLDEAHTVTITNSTTGKTKTVVASPYVYMRVAIAKAKSDQPLANVSTALALYSAAAKACLGTEIEG